MPDSPDHTTHRRKIGPHELAKWTFILTIGGIAAYAAAVFIWIL